MKNKVKLNFWIDVLMMLFMMAIGGIGFLIKYVLVPGSKRWEIYKENVELFFLGMDRHQWGSIHLVLGFILLGLLLLHIILHWGQIKCMYQRVITRKAMRFVLFLLFIIVCLLFLLFSTLISVDVVPIGQGEGRQSIHGTTQGYPRSQAKSTVAITQDEAQDESEETHKNEHKDEHENEHDIYVTGQMTLRQVSNTYNIPTHALKEALDLPTGISSNEKLGRLRRRYDFRMSDVSHAIAEYHKKTAQE